MNEADAIFSAIGKILASLGGGAVLIFAFSAWLGRVWAERIMRNETARHSENLQKLRAKLTENLEELRASIKRTAFKFETRFSRLHTARAEVIADLFKKLVALHRAAQSHLPGVLGGEQYKKTFSECLKEAKDSFEPNEIYFDETLCKSIETFLNKLDYYNYEKLMDQSTRIPGQTDPDLKARMMERSNYVNEVMPELKRELTNEFRALLGVAKESDDGSATIQNAAT